MEDPNVALAELCQRIDTLTQRVESLTARIEAVVTAFAAPFSEVSNVEVEKPVTLPEGTEIDQRSS